MSDIKPEGLLFATRIRAELDQLPDVDGWAELASRLRTAGEAGRQPLPFPARRRHQRPLVLALAGCAILALMGSGTALAGSGVLGGWLQSVGLSHTTARITSPQAGATHAGVTVKATEAYRDSYLVAMALEVDDPAPDRNAVLNTGSGAPSLVTSSGQVLQLVGDRDAMGVSGGQSILVFAAPDGGRLTGEDLTLTVPQITRFLAPEKSKASRVIQGPWVFHLHLPASASSARALSAPAPGTVGKVQVTYHDFSVSGGYLSGRVDVAELEPNVVAFTGVERPGTETSFWVYGPDGSLLEPVAMLGDDPGKGPARPAVTTPKTYHWGYLFPAHGPGTYRLVMHSGGATMDRDLQVP
jgi:hypothetical protein